MIELKHLNKTFHLKSGDVEAVKDVSLHIERGAIYGIIGYSGAGKSTLVRCLNLLETPDNGFMRIGSDKVFLQNGVAYAGEDSHAPKMKPRQMNGLRRGVGMIFQHFNLLDRSTVFQNVAYPLQFGEKKGKDIDKRVMELLSLVGLTDKADVYPSQLSGGQKQRVAIARALANNPQILLSDEATSALDPEATEAILTLLKDLNRKLGLTIVLITHEMAVIKTICHRVAVMEGGEVVEEGEVYDIFAQPQADITRRFVSSASPLGKVDKLLRDGSALVSPGPLEQLIQLTFQRDSVGEHVISTVSRRFDVNLSIVLANVEILDDSPLGGMVAIISGAPDKVAAALTYLNESHVKTEVLANGH